jgi:release factor glutamine methyltransferase
MCARPDSHARAIVARLRAAGCVYAEDEARLLLTAARSPEELDAMVARRAGGEPLEYVLGWAEFAGLRIAVDRGVFVPRRRTEFLVGVALELLRTPTSGNAHGPAPVSGERPDPARPPIVVDLGCGSGAIGTALLDADGRLDLYAVDIDPAAVACARRNLAGRARVFEGDLYEPLPGSLRGCVDLIVANAPYVPTGAIGTLPPEAREHESRVALDGGEDGLALQRRIAADATVWLSPGGHLLLETSESQSPATTAIVEARGLVARVLRSDELDATVVVGTKQPGLDRSESRPSEGDRSGGV